MKLSIENKIRAGFALALAFLLLIAVVSYLSATKSVQTFRATAHAERVLGHLEQILRGMLDVETGGRGYVMGGSESFLEPFETGRAAAERSARELRELIAGHPEQQRRADRLERLMAGRIARTEALIATRKAGGLEAAAAEVAKGEGKQVMDEIRVVVSEMEGAEQALRDRDSVQAQAMAHTTIGIVSFGSLVAMVLVGVAGMIVRRDFQRRQRAEGERDRFFALSVDMLCIANSDGYFKRLSPAFTETLGWSVGEMLARSFLDFVHPDDRAATLREVEKQVVRGEKVLLFENRYQHKDGSWRVLSWRSVPGPDGFMFATARDVTDQNRAKAEIERLNVDLRERAAQLESANRELEAFSYSVSHDLRAPLRHIDGYAARLAKAAGDNLDEKSRRCLKIITDAAREMGQLIDDLLLFSRVGRVEMRTTLVDLQEVVEQAIANVQAEANGRTLLWKQAPLPKVQGDPALLKQVFVNLLSNAVKYTRPRNPAEIEIGVAGEADGEAVIFVRDNGVGFEMEYADKLFGVFQRLHRSDEFEGTGIGLANVRRIIERHGGRTWAQGKVDKGATFFISLSKTPKG